MKKYYSILFILAGIVLALSSCLDVPEPFGSDATPGMEVTYFENTESLIFERNPDLTVMTTVDISGRWLVKSEAFLDRFEIHKILYTQGNEEIGRSIVARDVPLNDTIDFSVTTGEELFEGLNMSADDIILGSYFVFELYGIYTTGDRMRVTNVFTTYANYVSFCDLPQLETGVWIATNKATSYTKEIELLFNEEKGYYYLTDFGLDWSNAADVWYGVAFALTCPLTEGDPPVFEFAGAEWAESTLGYTKDMVGREGTIETRELRMMFYVYQEDSPKGYYDTETGELVFEGINVTDGWWNWDKHTGLSLRFKKK